LALTAICINIDLFSKPIVTTIITIIFYIKNICLYHDYRVCVCVCVCVHRRYISDNIEQNSFLSSNLRRRFDRTKNQHQISCETREE